MESIIKDMIDLMYEELNSKDSYLTKVIKIRDIAYDLYSILNDKLRAKVMKDILKKYLYDEEEK